MLSSPFKRTRPAFGQPGVPSTMGTPPIFDPNQHMPVGEQTSAVSVDPQAPKRVHAFDKEHIADTLLSIGQGFLSSQNFGEGLGNAAGAILNQNNAIRKEQIGSTSYGGPDDRFRITRYPDGREAIEEVPEFSAAVREKATLAKQPSADKTLDFRARAIYAISQLPVEQRAAAYQHLKTNPEAFGIDATGLPEQWDDNYGRVAGGMGIPAGQAANLELGRDRLGFQRDSFERRQAFNEGKEAKRGIKAKAPPSKRGGRKAAAGNSDLSYLLN